MTSTPLILAVAPNGAYKNQLQHPAIPLTPAELAVTARDCLAQGAAMLHLHVRRSDGTHSLEAEDYRRATEAVRKAVGQELVIQITTEAAQVYGPEAQMQVVRELVPEAVSVGLRELRVPALGEQRMSEFFQWLAQSQVMTQVILYDQADVIAWNELRKQGVIPEGNWFLLFVLGRYSAGQVSSPLDLLPFLQAWDGRHPWAICAFGASEHACSIAAASFGGHVRVGFENNLLMRDGTLAPNNAALVRQVAEGALVLGRPLACAEDIRQRFLNG